ncbi:MAG: alanine--tRNA ligase [Proteobacteria bacterium]|nr:alanine--tRNA ligase [Pseudomonadota bacterium]
MKATDVRQVFLRFFGEHGHEVVRSASLIPHNDPTLYFVNAGMVQFKDVFVGADVRNYSRATSSQKCLRVSGKHNDLDNVGRTPRHHTFFEMLGNFSFGDYFKSEAIPLAYELLTGPYGIDPRRLWVTIYEDDDEAFDLWRSTVDFPAERIQRLGADENFWSMGPTGPCGPCTEIHYDHGPSISNDERGPAGGDDRYVEIWNLVFMQFEQLASGERINLPRPSIDTGMGLERLAAVAQGVYSNYDTDLFTSLILCAAQEADVRYGRQEDADVALRVIADHSRATAFLVGDGVMPSNEGRGYVLRRIMRRAIRFGVKLDIERPFFHNVTNQVLRDFGDLYPELLERQTFIEEVVRGEEERFRRTLGRGMRLLDSEFDRLETGATLPGGVAFTLADTFGFPLDLTQLIAEERGIAVDGEGFNQALEEQRARGRAAWKGSGEQGIDSLWPALAQEVGHTHFTGYDREQDVATIAALVRVSDAGIERLDNLSAGERGIVILDRTPFYGEAGGQVGDTGTIGALTVEDTTRASGLILHHGIVGEGGLAVSNGVSALVDTSKRAGTRRNHTATHLLHAALREVLGKHVTQKGSLVGPERLRFDFAHHKPVTEDELRQIETRVNGEVLRNILLATEVMELDAAIASGAMALFGEKYDDRVRMVTVPGFSVELCGGTHVERTGDIGFIKVIGETGIAAGVRRLEGQTGMGALALIQAEAMRIDEAALELKASRETVVEAILRLKEERKRLEREVQELERDKAKDAAKSLLDGVREIGGVKVLAAEFEGNLREQADRLRDQLGTSVVVLAMARGPKLQLLAAATKDIAGKRVHAGKLVGRLAEEIGGRGGGRPDMAQAGGKCPDSIPDLLQRAYVIIEEQLGSS